MTAGCSKRPSSATAASEEAQRMPLSPAPPIACRNRPLPRPYIEPLSDARTKLGERRVSACRGWVGEKSDFFNILLRSTA